jgi:hypothetical protein
MVRTAKVVVWLVALPVAAGLVATAAGAAEPYLYPSDLPVAPFQGVIAGFGVLVVGIVVSGILDRRAWKQMGATVGLSTSGESLDSDPPERGGGLFGYPHLTGTIRGRQVRARTYQTGGGSDDSSRTYTVIETALQHPVEWTAVIAPASDAEMHHLPSVETEAEHWTTIDSEFAIWGDISEEQARELLTPEIRDSLATLDGGVIVGDAKQEILNQFANAIPEDTEGMGATAASGFLNMVGAGEETGPSRLVKHQERGLLVDSAALQRRAEAIVAVAGAIERANAH